MTSEMDRVTMMVGVTRRQGCSEYTIMHTMYSDNLITSSQRGDRIAGHKNAMHNSVGHSTYAGLRFVLFAGIEACSVSIR